MDRPGRPLAVHPVLVGYLAWTLVVIVVFAAFPDRPWGSLALAVAMPLLALYLLREGCPGRLRGWTLAALALSWLGDTVGVTLLIKLGFFLVAQILYVVAFWPTRHRLARRRTAAGSYVAGIVVLLVVLAAGAGPLRVPVLAYGLTLGVMAVLAWTVDWRCGLGGVLFVISDVVLAWAEFVTPGSVLYVGAINAVFYLPGQALLVLGVVHRSAAAMR